MRLYVRVLIALLALLAAACGRADEDGSRLRIGYMARLTHAPALTGLDSGRFERALPDVQLESRPFEVGNAVVEALFADELDVAVLGPNPAINGFVRSHGELRIVSGVSSGGSAFVVGAKSHIRAPSDLHGASIGTPQIASTQDVALRAYLRRHGLASTLAGGDVRVLPLGSAEIRQLLTRGEIDGAWISEPLVSELVEAGKARVLVDERDEWPDGRYPAAVLVVRKRYQEAQPENVRRFLRSLRGEIAWVEAHRPEALALTRAGIGRRLGKSPPEAVLAEAARRVAFSPDPLLPALEKVARDAEAEGFLPPGRSRSGLWVDVDAPGNPTEDVTP